MGVWSMPMWAAQQMLQVWTWIQSILRSLVPCFVSRVVYLNTEEPGVEVVYDAWQHMYSWKRSNVWTVAPPTSGFYAIHMWCPIQHRYEYYLLSVEHLREALGVESLSSLWAISEYGLGILVHAHVQFHHKNSMLGLLWKKDHNSPPVDLLEDPLMKRYKESLMLPGNATPNVVEMLYTYETGGIEEWLQRAKKDDFRHAHVTVVDFDLEETEVAGNQPFVPKRQHPIKAGNGIYLPN